MLRRILPSIAIFVLLGLFIFIVIHGMTDRLPGWSSIVSTLDALGILASLCFAVGYLITPLVRRQSKDATNDRPWRPVLVILGADIILWLGRIPFMILELGFISDELSGAMALTKPGEIFVWPIEFQIANIVSTSLLLLAAVAYMLYPLPRSLRSSQGDVMVAHAISPREQIDG